MSGFFGVFRPGGNVDRLAIDQMQTAIQRDGYDELETHIDDHIAMGHLMLRVTPESAYDKQPLKSNCGRYILVGHFRLDYRDELGDKLGLTQKELDVSPDSLLAIMAYQKWADKCVHHLEGDWAFLLYDVKSRKVTLARDPIGFSAVFFTIQNGQIYFSSDSLTFISVQSLKFSLNFKEINNLADVRKSITPGQSLFNEVFSVAPGEYVQIDNNQEINYVKYFNEFKASKVLFKSELDYQLEFQSVFMNSIYTRISNVINLGISLSSGRDSTSVFYFANKISEYKKKYINTYTWSSFESPNVSEEKKRRLDESYRVESMLRDFNFVIPYFIHGHNQVYSQSFSNKKSRNCYNPIVHVNSIWIDEMFCNSRLNQNTLMLVAAFGNFTITWNGPFVNHSLKYQFGLFLSIRNRIVYLKRLLKRVFKSFSNFFSAKNSRLLKTRFLEEDGVSGSHLLKNIRFQYNSNTNINSIILGGLNKDFALRKEILERGMVNVGATWYLDSFDYGLTVADPTADKRLIDFCFSIPGKYFNYDGGVRYLYKKMMKGKLPNSIIESDKVYPQAYNSGEKLVKDDEIDRLMNEIRNDKYLGAIIDIQHLDNSYQNSKRNPLTVENVIAVNVFLKELSVVEFIRKNSNFNEWINKQT
jgi:asparagine synthase (glutamine-hydrolysing)